MAESVKLRKELVQLGRDLGYEGEALANFVTAEYNKEEEKEREEKEREREEKEKDREEKEREKEREHEIRLKEIEVRARQESLESQTSQQSGSRAGSPNTNPTPDTAMTFPLDPFNDRLESIDLYLDRFEALANEYNLDNSKWNLKLSQALRGVAYDTYAKLPPQRRNEYTELRSALLRRYELTPEAYRQKFRTLRKEKTETFAQFTDRLDSCLQKWLQLSPFEETFEGLWDLILTDQLRDAMSPEVRRFTTEQGAQTLGDVITHADRFMTARETDRFSRNSERPVNSSSIKKPNTPQAVSKPSQSSQPIRPPPPHNQRKYCFHCKMSNHNTQDCRKVKKHTAAAVSRPIKGQPDHTADESGPDKDTSPTAFGHAPSVTEAVTVNGNTVMGLYDTGLAFDAVVKEEFVLPGQLTGKTIPLQGPDLSASSWDLPIAHIQVTSRYVNGTIAAAVMKAPAYDLILGCRYVFLGTPTTPLTVSAVQTRAQKAADSLPPLPANPLPQEMAEAQKSDATLERCFKKLPTSHTPPHSGDFFIKSGLLHRQSRKGQAQLVVPKSNRQQVLEMGHDISFSGHTGTGATMQRISAYYYWPGIHEELKRFIRSCPQCQKTSARTYSVPVTLGKLQVGDQVLLLLPQGSNKLQLSWQGPYPVSEKVSRTNYKIRVHGKEKTYHLNLLKKFHVRQPFSELMAMTIAEEVEATQDLAVDYPLISTEGISDVTVNPNLSGTQRQHVSSLLGQYEGVLTDRPGRTDLVEVNLTLTDSAPIRCKPYPVPLAKEKVIQSEIHSMLKAGIISPSESPYSAPVILLRKPSGEHRLCVDYRRLNSVVEFQAEPLPNLPQLFAHIQNAQYFSKIDLAKGYYQIPVPSHLRQYLAFSTTKGHYEFNVLPFGLHNAPSIFSRMMKKLLGPLNHPHIHHFMDDILVATPTWDGHVNALRALLGRLKETGLTARPSKCVIGFQELEFLGHTLHHGCMQPEEKNVEKMRLAPHPRSKRDVRSFLGLCGFYQKFIPHYNSIAAPLSELTKKKAPERLNWTPACERAFQSLKEKLTSKPILRLPRPESPFVLRTDACKDGLGAALLQPDEQDPTLLLPVAYASRKLQPAEQNYAIVEQECLALVWGIQKFQLYLYGKHFTVQCDHQPLLFLASSQHLNARLMRWALLLQPYSFHIQHIAGNSNHAADFLSRHPAELNSPANESGQTTYPGQSFCDLGSPQKHYQR